MKSQLGARRALAATVVGVLVGGGLMSVTPAGAEVATAAATSWKKIWKKELKPLADKRYYTKKTSDSTFVTKAESAASAAAAQSAATSAANSATDSKLNGYYTKAQADAKYDAAGSGYTKAESDAKYAPYPKTIRGVFTARDFSTAANQWTDANVSWGFTLAAVPTAVYVLDGTTNTNCPGTAANPQAKAGFACFYELGAVGVTAERSFYDPYLPGASAYGVDLRITSVGTGQYGVFGRWAVTPATGVSASLVGPKSEGEAQVGPSTMDR